MNKWEFLKDIEKIKNLTMQELKTIFEKVDSRLSNENNLVELGNYEKVIFVGDIHGDFDVLKKIVQYIRGKNAIVFLGDYIDRGENSKEVINFLLYLYANFNNIFLLMGNHEAYPIIPCQPNDFWKGISIELAVYYKKILSRLPLALSLNNLLALHACLPDIKSMKEIDNIKHSYDDKDFYLTLWGDFVDREGLFLGSDPLTGRKKYGRKYFNKKMKSLGKRVLVRGHDYRVKGNMFDDKCLTLFTSKSYEEKGNLYGRFIGVLENKREVNSTSDISMVKI